MFYIAIGAAAALGLFLAWFFSAGRRNAARRAAVKKISDTMGTDMDEYGPVTSLLEGTGLPFFLEARKGVGRNMLRFSDDENATGYFFDFAFIGAGEKKVECTAALFEFKKDGLPSFFVSGDGAGAQPAMAGFDPVDVKTMPGLPDGAKVYSADPAGAAALFNPEKASLIASDPSWNVQGGGRFLLLYKAGYVAPMGSYHQFIDSAKKLAWRLTA